MLRKMHILIDELRDEHLDCSTMFYKYLYYIFRFHSRHCDGQTGFSKNGHFSLLRWTILYYPSQDQRCQNLFLNNLPPFYFSQRFTFLYIFIFIKDLSSFSYFLLSDLCTEIYCRICDEVIKSHDIGAALRSVGMETIF